MIKAAKGTAAYNGLSEGKMSHKHVLPINMYKEVFAEHPVLKAIDNR